MRLTGIVIPLTSSWAHLQMHSAGPRMYPGMQCSSVPSDLHNWWIINLQSFSFTQQHKQLWITTTKQGRSTCWRVVHVVGKVAAPLCRKERQTQNTILVVSLSSIPSHRATLWSSQHPTPPPWDLKANRQEFCETVEVRLGSATESSSSSWTGSCVPHSPHTQLRLAAVIVSAWKSGKSFFSGTAGEGRQRMRRLYSEKVLACLVTPISRSETVVLSRGQSLHHFYSVLHCQYSFGPCESLLRVQCVLNGISASSQ